MSKVTALYLGVASVMENRTQLGRCLMNSSTGIGGSVGEIDHYDQSNFEADSGSSSG